MEFFLLKNSEVNNNNNKMLRKCIGEGNGDLLNVKVVIFKQNWSKWTIMNAKVNKQNFADKGLFRNGFCAKGKHEMRHIENIL